MFFPVKGLSLRPVNSFLYGEGEMLREHFRKR